MNEYWLVGAATLGVAMTLAALFGLCMVAGLRWALVDGRWKRTRTDLFMVGLSTWVNRAASLARLLVRSSERPPGRRGV